MTIGIRIGVSIGGNGGNVATSSLTINGLTAGEARPGNHAALSVGFPSGVTAWTNQTWGVGVVGDTTYGTGASPTDYTASDGLTLLWEGLGDDGNTYSASAPIRYAAPVATGALVDQSFTQGTGNRTYDPSGDFTFDGTLSFSLVPPVADVSIDAVSGLITFETNEIDIQTGTTITVRAADANDSSRFAVSSFDLAITLAPSASTPVNASASYTPGSGGNAPTISIGGNYSGDDTLTLVAYTGTEPIVFGTPEDLDAGNGTGFLERFEVPGFTYENGSFSPSGLTNGNFDAIVFIVKEDNNGGISDINTELVGLSGADLIAPFFAGAEVGLVNANTLRAAFDSAMYGSTSAADWALAGNTVASIVFTPGNAFVDLILGTTATSGDDYTGDLSYSGSGLTDAASNPLAAFSGADVTNNLGGSGAAATDLWETGTITSTEVTQSMNIGTANANREVLFLVGMEGGDGKAAGFDFTVNGTSYEGGAEELGSQFTSNASVFAANVPVATGTTATVGLTHGSSGLSLANSTIAIPHNGSVVSGGVATDYSSNGSALTGSVTTEAGGSLHILLFGRDENFDTGTITITDPSGATLEATIVTENDIASDVHPNNSNYGRAYVKLEGTSAGTTTINISTTAPVKSRWTMVAVALDS